MSAPSLVHTSERIFASVNSKRVERTKRMGISNFWASFSAVGARLPLQKCFDAMMRDNERDYIF